MHRRRIAASVTRVYTRLVGAIQREAFTRAIRRAPPPSPQLPQRDVEIIAALKSEISRPHRCPHFAHESLPFFPFSFFSAFSSERSPLRFVSRAFAYARIRARIARRYTISNYGFSLLRLRAILIVDSIVGSIIARPCSLSLWLFKPRVAHVWRTATCRRVVQHVAARSRQCVRIFIVFLPSVRPSVRPSIRPFVRFFACRNYNVSELPS